jgi:outer membrane protein OmpA-like peptidoglycan-associated protein
LGREELISMKKLILFYFPFFPILSFSQELILNGGFEDENICTEFVVNCAPEAWISSGSALANYFRDPNRAYKSEHCMAVQAGHSTRPYERTFIRSQLLCRLRKGNKYRLSLFIKSPHPILDSIGAYFGPIEPLMERKPVHLLSASLYFGTSNTFKKDSSWQPVTADYTAAGDEVFITIANYSHKDVNGYTGASRRNQFLVFLDDISLVPLDPDEKLCDNWEQVKQDIYDFNPRHQFLWRMLKYNRDSLIVPLHPTRMIIADTLLLPDVLFATGKKDLQPASHSILDSFCRQMNGRKIDSVVVDGHTDNTGTVAFNEQLSAGRAGSAASYLSRCASFANMTIITRAWGSRKPVTENSTPANRQRNRRVEIFVYFKE